MNDNYVDNARSADLTDVGLANYLAATVIDEDGTEHAILAERESIGNPSVRYDPTCGHAPHEQLGALPLWFIRRITISRRTYRCGRPTKAGPPCRMSVPRQGDACAWHGTQANTNHPQPKGTPNA